MTLQLTYQEKKQRAREKYLQYREQHKERLATYNKEYLEGGGLEKGKPRVHGIQQQEERAILENKYGGHRASGRDRSEERFWKDNPSRSGEHCHREEILMNVFSLERIYLTHVP